MGSGDVDIYTCALVLEISLSAKDSGGRCFKYVASPMYFLYCRILFTEKK